MKLSILIHRLFYSILKPNFARLLEHEFVFLNEKPTIDGNVIYAFNHSCKFDSQYVYELAESQCFLLVGKQRLKFIDRISYGLLGVVWADRKKKRSKRKAVIKMKRLLNGGANVAIFPEATWNLAPSSPTLPLYWGVIDIARDTQKPIVPVVLEYVQDKVCYVSFGKVMNISPDDDKKERIDDLKEQFSTMKWEIWEKHPEVGFDTQEQWDNEIKRRLAEYPKLDYEYEQSVIRQL